MIRGKHSDLFLHAATNVDEYFKFMLDVYYNVMHSLTPDNSSGDIRELVEQIEPMVNNFLLTISTVEELKSDLMRNCNCGDTLAEKSHNQCWTDLQSFLRYFKLYHDNESGLMLTLSTDNLTRFLPAGDWQRGVQVLLREDQARRDSVELVWTVDHSDYPLSEVLRLASDRPSTFRSALHHILKCTYRDPLEVTPLPDNTRARDAVLDVTERYLTNLGSVDELKRLAMSMCGGDTDLNSCVHRLTPDGMVALINCFKGLDAHKLLLSTLDSESSVFAVGSLSDQVLAAIPPAMLMSLSDCHAGLCDNGASLGSGCTNSMAGAIPGSLRKTDSGSMTVGDSNATLESMGSYLYLHERWDNEGKGEVVARRLKYCPSLSVQTVYDEASENQTHGYDIIWPAGKARYWKTPAGKTMTLIMSDKRLGWLKVRPVTDKARVAEIVTKMISARQIDATKELGQDKEDDKLMVMKTGSAVPTGTSMGRAPMPTGVDLLRRMHIVLGHVGLKRVVETLAASKQFKAGCITKADIEQFAREGYGVCESTKMKRRPFPHGPSDSTPPPPGKRWVCDALDLRIPAAGYGYVKIYRCVCAGTGYRVMFGLLGSTAEDIEAACQKLRARVRPDHGEIHILRLDAHPSHKSKLLADYCADSELLRQVAPGHVHEGAGLPEVTFMHDVPAANALLMAAPDLNEAHFYSAFHTVEKAVNQAISGSHQPPTSAEMRYYQEGEPRPNYLHVYGSAAKSLIHPEARDSKFDKHSKPCVYTGPAHFSSSDKHCSVWDGDKYEDKDLGCTVINEDVPIAISKRDHPSHQPFNQCALTKPVDVKPAEAVDDLIDKDAVDTTDPEVISPIWVCGAPPPTCTFVVLLWSGKLRAGNVAAWLSKLSNNSIMGLPIDQKVGGAEHNTSLPRVQEGIASLLAHQSCVGGVFSPDCSSWTPLRFKRPGPMPLFDCDSPNGILDEEGNLPPETEKALKSVEVFRAFAEVLLARGAVLVVEQPANQGSKSIYSSQGREKHSTMFDTDMVQSLIDEYRLGIVMTEQGAFGAATRKPTALLCSPTAMLATQQHIGTKFVAEPTQTETLVGVDADGHYQSGKSEVWTSDFSKGVATAVVKSVATKVDNYEPYVPTAPAHEDDTSHAACEDLYPIGTRVEVFWTAEKRWYAGTVSRTEVSKGDVNGKKMMRRVIHVYYDLDNEVHAHAIHNNMIRAEKVTSLHAVDVVNNMIVGDVNMLMACGLNKIGEQEKMRVQAILEKRDAWEGQTMTSSFNYYDIGQGSFDHQVMLFTISSDQVIETVLPSDSLDPKLARFWHCPANERDYQRSPQKSMWRTAKELKIDEYQTVDLYDLVERSQVPKDTKVYQTLWAYKIKLEDGALAAHRGLNPRWCVKAGDMDSDLYKSYTEMVRPTTVNILIAIKCEFYDDLCDFQIDESNAFQATRTVDDSTGVKVGQPMLKGQTEMFVEQAPGFVKYGTDGQRMVCRLKAGMQGRIDSTRLHSDRINALLLKVMMHSTLWDRELRIYNNTSLRGTSASLKEIIEVTKVDTDSGQGQPPIGWAAMGAHVDDNLGLATGSRDRSKNRIVAYVLGAIQEVYATTCTGWNKFLGRKLSLDAERRTIAVSARNQLDAICRELLEGVVTVTPKHIMTEAFFELKLGEVPEMGDPARDGFIQMQALCKKALGVCIWLVQSYPALAAPTAICCGTMHSPSYEMLACLRHIAMYMITHDEPLTFGGAHVGSIFPPMDQAKLLEPFNTVQKAGYYHYFSDASNRDPSISGGAGMIKGGVMQTACLRQHLTAPCSHTSEVVSAGTNLHLIVPVNGTLQELGIRLGVPTPFYVDSKSTSFVCKAETSVKKSAWILRRVKVLHEGVQYDEIFPIHIPECDMVADGFTKYIPTAVWRRHMHYLLNKGLDYPPGKQNVKGSAKAKEDAPKENENA